MNEEKLKLLSKWRDELKDKRNELNKQRIEINHKIWETDKELSSLYSLLGESCINTERKNNPYGYIPLSEKFLKICKEEFKSDFTVKSLLIITQNSNDEKIKRINETRLSAILGNLAKENEIKLISRGKSRIPSVYSNTEMILFDNT